MLFLLRRWLGHPHTPVNRQHTIAEKRDHHTRARTSATKSRRPAPRRLEFASLEERDSFSNVGLAGLLFAASGGIAAGLLLKAAWNATADSSGWSVVDSYPVRADTSDSQGDVLAWGFTLVNASAQNVLPGRSWSMTIDPSRDAPSGPAFNDSWAEAGTGNGQGTDGSSLGLDPGLAASHPSDGGGGATGGTASLGVNGDAAAASPASLAEPVAPAGGLAAGPQGQGQAEVSSGAPLAVSSPALPSSPTAPAPGTSTSAVPSQLPAPLPAASAAQTPPAGPASGTSPSTSNLPTVPLGFEPNVGQVADTRQQFVAHGPDSAFFVAATTATLVLEPNAASAAASLDPTSGNPALPASALRPAVVQMQFVGANPDAHATGDTRLSATSNYFLGSDPQQWHTDVPTYAQVRLAGVYPGIDLVYHTANSGPLEYDWVVSPQADPGVIQVAFSGAQDLHLDAQGNLVLDTSAGPVQQQAPVLYQDIDGVRHSIAGHFVLGTDHSVRVAVGAYDHSRPLTIDPVLGGSTYLGGSGSDMGKGIAVDEGGNVYVTGIATSTNFPTLNAFQSTFTGTMDAFVSKFDPTGKLIYSTYLGGNGLQEGAAIAADAAGNAYVTGDTTATNFPVTAGAYQTARAGSLNAYVTKLTPGGNSLGYSTYLGGSGSDQGMAIAVDNAGNATAAGLTSSPNFPTKQPFQATLQGSSAAFVTRLNATGSGLVYSTYLGGNGTSSAGGVALDSAGSAYVTGSTTASNFPTVNAVQPNYVGRGDAFITKLTYSQATGLQPVYSTYLGGNGLNAGSGIAVDGYGRAYVTGYTSSANFPTRNAIQPTYQGGSSSGTDAFVTRLTAAGALDYSTYLGGSGDDYGRGIAVDTAGNATIAGQTTSKNFPTKSPLQAANAGQQNVFVTRLNTSGSAYLFSTYLGGSKSDYGLGVALDCSGNAYVAGYTYSNNFPVSTGAWQGSLRGTMNAFVSEVKVPLPPPMPSSYEAGAMPQVAAGMPDPNTAFAATCQAPVNVLNGATVVRTPTVETGGFDPMTPNLDWTNGATDPPNNGSGMLNTDQPYLIQTNCGNTIIVVTGGFDTTYFDLTSGTYTPRFFSQDRLTHNTSTNEFVYADTLGDTIHFNDFSPGLPANQQGSFNSFVDPAGNISQVTARTPDGQITEYQRSTTVNGTTTTESFLYTFVSTGVNAGLVASLTLRRSTDGGNTWSVVRQAAYVYYDGTQSYGNAGDLQTVTILDANNNVLDTTYFRYYTPADAGTTGYVHGLKYYVTPQSYARLVAAVGTPTTATDAQVTTYADDYFQYDSQRRVTEEVAQGEGCSDCSAGQGTFAYSYTTSTNPDGFNAWKVKATETLPDGNQNIYYVNAYDQEMLKAYHDVTTGQSWEWFTAYDNQGRATLEANPSAVTGYDDTKPDLLNNQGGTYQFLNNQSGLITLTDYYTTTTAGESTPAGVAGYRQDTKLEQGQQGTPILQETWQYDAHTAAGITVSPVATDTVYRNTDGTGAETTTSSYTWFAGTVQKQSMTTTWPVISAAQNGPGVADQQVSYFDTYDREIWHMDGDGFIEFTAYDAGTGAVVRTITDVDTARTGDFQNLPPGWSTPAGGGLHLITTMQVDSLGRDKVMTDPNGNVTYTTYDDLDHEYRVYPGWNAATGLPTGPTQVYREDRPGSYTETLTMSATPHLTGGVPDGTEPISNLQTLSRTYISAGGQITDRREYFNLSGLVYATTPVLGTEGVNFYDTRYGYDDRGRQDRVQHPTGTIDRTVYDGLDRVVSTWVGTNDTPASGEWDPTNNTSPSNMFQVTASVYDNGGTGDSNLTQTTDFPGSGAAPRVSQYFYDFRDRQVANKSGVQATENDGTNRPITYTVYDNLDEPVLEQEYTGDGVSINTVNGVPQPPAASLLRAQTATSYDDQGRVYREQVYDVNPITGAVSTAALTTNTYYDHRGDEIATSEPGGTWTKDVYDGAGRLTTEFMTDGGGGTSWPAAGSVSGDIVLEQTQSVYDGNGIVIETMDSQRFHNATGTGALGGPTSTTPPPARVSYTASYYDAVDRLTETANVGTNGGAAYTRPSTPPAPSDTALVTQDIYNAAGWVQDVIDPRGLDSRTLYDNLGRTTTTIADCTNGTPTNTSNYTTNYTYDGDGHSLTIAAVQPAGIPSQITQYVYGVSPANGSVISSNDLLATVMYPDPVTGAASSSPSQEVTYTYNALGQTTSMEDRNGTTHTYTYDVLGRQTSDAATMLGTKLPVQIVDGAVRRIDTTYDQQGNPYLFTSYADTAGTTLVNQVEDVFNGLGQLTGEYQAHAGPVVVGTTPEVQYAYNELSNGENNSRLTSTTYPNGRVLTFNYNSGLDDHISRLSSISDNSGILESYTYLGAGVVVQRAHPQDNVNLTYISPTGSTNDAGDQYTGLDRFGRVAEQLWLNTGTNTATDDFLYTYDRDSNVLTRSNTVNSAFNEQYAYDNNNQITSFTRGSHTQAWNYDALGNWLTVTTDGAPQTRTANAQNQYASISGQATAPMYDNNGNLINDPTNGHTYVYDAWNRLVAVKNGSTTLESYTYDALRRRITETTGSQLDLYYNTAWQVIEEQASGKTRAQYVWCPLLSDTLIERDSNPSGGVLTLRLYVQQDANGNVTALVDTSGNVQERYVYDPFGTFTVFDASWHARGGSLFGWRYLFQGLRYDPTSGLYYSRNRDYSPTLGRFLEQDPLGFNAEDSNLYRFVHNDPIDATDPAGLKITRTRGGKFNVHPEGSKPYPPNPLGARGIGYFIKVTFTPTNHHCSCTSIKIVQFARRLIKTPTRWKPIPAIGAGEAATTFFGRGDWHVDTMFPVWWYVFPGKYGSCGAHRSPAVITDAPGEVRNGEFEAIDCAICTAGRDKGKYFGGVMWGFRVDALGRAHALRQASVLKSARAFNHFGAVKAWNAHEAVKIPRVK
jgi:RHS repeat-associated protein